MVLLDLYLNNYHSERLCNIFQLDAFLMEPDHKGMSQVVPVKPNDISIFQRARKPSPSNCGGTV